MQKKDWIRAVIVAVFVAPLIGVAQSSTENVCERDFRFNFDRSIERCSTQSDRAACEQAAALAMKTCLAWCPENRAKGDDR